MRPLSLIVGLLMIASCYALKIASMEEYYQNEQNTITQESLKLTESRDARLPVKSAATPGEESRHHVAFAGISTAIFIMGDDALSKEWLNNHVEELRKRHALGFITNIKNPETLHELESKYELPLLPANVDDLMTVLGATHYPLIMNEGIVWQ